MDEELLIDGWECDFEQYDYDDFEPDDIRDYLWKILTLKIWSTA